MHATSLGPRRVESDASVGRACGRVLGVGFGPRSWHMINGGGRMADGATYRRIGCGWLAIRA